jgi:hypothetical protein
MTKKDIQQLRAVLRYISTSDPSIQKEVLRLDALLADMQKPKPKETK